MMLTDHPVETNQFETVDAYEMEIRSSARKWGPAVHQLVMELRTLPTGKALKKRFSEKEEQQSFANAVQHTLNKMSMDKDYMVSKPKPTEDGAFVVYIGRRQREDAVIEIRKAHAN